ncbi:hypothetical protein [Mycobacterium sp. SMC-14]|uniref:hypothetical protein n=1 Tax=Mycobacterium sp. SMC-14 TaxID=3385968 RepID=UPI00390CC13D
MSKNEFTHPGRIAAGLSVAAGGAVAAALIGLGAAGIASADPYVDTYSAPDPYDVLFGAQGTDQGQQGWENNALDQALFDQSATNYATFYQDVVNFEENSGEHGVSNLIYAIDPSAFYEQTSADITGTLVGGAYLVPDDALGYLATGLDFGLLSPIGLDFVLTPLIDILLGEPPAI